MIYNQYAVNSHTTDKKNRPLTDSWFYKISQIHYIKANEWMHKKLNSHAQIMYYTTFYIQLAIVNNLTKVSLRQCLNLDWLKSDFNKAAVHCEQA